MLFYFQLVMTFYSMVEEARWVGLVNLLSLGLLVYGVFGGVRANRIILQTRQRVGRWRFSWVHREGCIPLISRVTFEWLIYLYILVPIPYILQLHTAANFLLLCGITWATALLSAALRILNDRCGRDM